ncbi:MAG: hypothetical protein HZA17_03865, partial [Nitrospirae bacterium]|nr:hypothetical protein [Nitrospirota bacterium]
MKKTNKRIGQLLLEAGLIDELQLKSALSYQQEWGGRLGSVIIKKGFVSEKDVVSIIEKQFGISCISLESIDRPADEVLNMVKLDIAKKFGIFPIGLEGKMLLLAVADPTDLKTLDDIRFVLGARIKPLLALESDIMRAIAVHYEGKVVPAREAPAASSSRTESASQRESSGAEGGVAPEIIHHETMYHETRTQKAK